MRSSTNMESNLLLSVTKQAMEIKTLSRENTYILKLFLQVVSAGTGPPVMIWNKVLYSYVKYVYRL
jgi:hypothetical protein